MIVFGYCKELIHSKKYKKFKADIILLDIFHNINIIRFKNGIKYKKEIIDKIDKGKIISINLLNSLLKQYDLYCGYTYDIRGIINYYDIVNSKGENIYEKYADLN